MKSRVSLETKIEPHGLVYYLVLKPMHHGGKAKVSQLDHCCLLTIVVSNAFLFFSSMFYFEAIIIDN